MTFYKGALFALHSVIRDEARRFRFLLEEGELSKEEERDYRALMEPLPMRDLDIPTSEGIIRGSLRFLLELLGRHYGQTLREIREGKTVDARTALKELRMEHGL